MSEKTSEETAPYGVARTEGFSFTNSTVDRLVPYLRSTRLSMYEYASTIELGFNYTLSRFFAAEKDVVSTIRSLKSSVAVDGQSQPARPLPDRMMMTTTTTRTELPMLGDVNTTDQTLSSAMMSAIVAGMGTSIFVRRRNILIRRLGPPTVFLATSAYLLPTTASKVCSLLDKLEQKYASAEFYQAHVNVQKRVVGFVQIGIAHSKMSVGMMEAHVASAREGLGKWMTNLFGR